MLALLFTFSGGGSVVVTSRHGDPRAGARRDACGPELAAFVGSYADGPTGGIDPPQEAVAIASHDEYGVDVVGHAVHAGVGDPTVPYLESQSGGPMRHDVYRNPCVGEVDHE